MISVVIPTLNEEDALPRTLDCLFDQHGDKEVIVVDGGSCDATPEVVAAYPEVRLLTAHRGRARQMNVGARAAAGAWLLFLHADTLLPAGALDQISALGECGDALAGGFRHRFSGHSWGLKLISGLNNRRVQRTRILYGDQAPFVRRTLFEELGGFPEQPILEDVLFMEKVVKVTRPVLLDQHVVTDSRRFTQQGVWRSFGRVFLIMSCYKLGLGVPATKFFSPVR